MSIQDGLIGLGLVVFGGLAWIRRNRKPNPIDPPEDYGLPDELPPWNPWGDQSPPAYSAPAEQPADYAPATEPAPAIVARLSWTPPAAAIPWLGAVRASELSNRLPENIIGRLIERESSWRADAVSPAGALGLAQFMPATALELGIDPLDPEQAIQGAGEYLRWCYDYLAARGLVGWNYALAGYNAGVGTVSRAGGIPNITETQNYVAAIWGYV